MEGWGVQIASDVVRDGLGLELLDSQGQVVAEVFRCDANNSVIVNTINNDIPLHVVEWAIRMARERLSPFEDGSPFPIST